MFIVILYNALQENSKQEVKFFLNVKNWTCYCINFLRKI